MVNEKNIFCECGEKLKRLYSRDQSGFNCLELYHCNKCSTVYEQKLNKKTLKKLSQKSS